MRFFSRGRIRAPGGVVSRDMSWMAYCWREAVECERLARIEEGETRAEWLEAAERWLDQSVRAAAECAQRQAARRAAPAFNP